MKRNLQNNSNKSFFTCCLLKIHLLFAFPVSKLYWSGKKVTYNVKKGAIPCIYIIHMFPNVFLNCEKGTFSFSFALKKHRLTLTGYHFQINLHTRRRPVRESRQNTLEWSKGVLVYLRDLGHTYNNKKKVKISPRTRLWSFHPNDTECDDLRQVRHYLWKLVSLFPWPGQ